MASLDLQVKSVNLSIDSEGKVESANGKEQRVCVETGKTRAIETSNRSCKRPKSVRKVQHSAGRCSSCQARVVRHIVMGQARRIDL